MKKTTLIALLAAVSVIACKKVKDTIPPVITITAPTSATMTTAGDSVQVAFTITDNDLHEVGYAITNATTNDTLFSNEEHTESNYSFNKKFKTPLTPMNIKLTVTAEDHSDNKSSASVSFHTM